MSRRTTVLALVVFVGFAGACARPERAGPAEEAWYELIEARNKAESAEEETAIAEDYLARFPDTEHSGSLARSIVYYRGHEMRDPRSAYNRVSAALEKIEDPEQRFEVSMALFSLAAEVEVPLALARVADELAAHRPLSFGEHQQVFETATNLEEWRIAADHAEAATALATPEVFRADYPDREFTDEDVAERARSRKATSLAYHGWATYNLGDAEAAFAHFAEADDVGSVNYLGVPNTPLYTFWGRAALNEGEIDSAIELLGAEAAFGSGASNAEIHLRRAYATRKGSTEGFEEFLWATRKELAATVDDFELLDYEGSPVSLAEVSAGKVTLLAFWFPT